MDYRCSWNPAAKEKSTSQDNVRVEKDRQTLTMAAVRLALLFLFATLGK